MSVKDMENMDEPNNLKSIFLRGTADAFSDVSDVFSQVSS